MNPDPVIRPYTPEEKESVLHLLRLNTPAFFSADEEKDFVYYLDHEIEYYFVVESGDCIVGCGGFNFSGNPKIGKISWDLLHPDFHGKGIGTKLLQYRINKLREFLELEKIIVRTSQMAYRFYEKSGFVVKETIPDYWAPGFDLVLMEYEPEILK